MNTSSKFILGSKDSKLNSPSKVTTLNPNAAEFVPYSLRSLSGNNKNADVTRLDVPETSGKTILDRSESTLSNNSDDEAHQYWRCQLPDDITPDFKPVEEEEMQVPSGLSLADLSINGDIGTSRFSTQGTKQFLGKQQEMSHHGSENVILSERKRHSDFTYMDGHPSATFMNLATNPWDKQYMNGDQHLTNGGEGDQYRGDSSAGFLSDLLNEHTGLESTTTNTVEFLATQFPGFATESLADVYYANGCDLNLTIEILAQLELQVDGGFNQNLNSKTLSAPSLSALDFPALPVIDAQNGLSKASDEDLQQSPNAYRSLDQNTFPFLKFTPSGTTRGTPDFASAVRKLASQDAGHWKHERNGSADVSIGTSRNSQSLTSSYNGHGKSVSADKLQNFGAVRVSPAWLETGDAVGNIYFESREEARDLARLRNAYFEQARQAYIIGNKALAKDLSSKGQYYNMQMKEAHEKARESIYRQRNPVAPELQSYSRGQDPLIDLHGLHVSEAIHVLKHELSVLRKTARSAGQRLQVMICVGTGHHTKGSRTPARLPVAVERHLLEEGLHFTEVQPGLLRVVIY